MYDDFDTSLDADPSSVVSGPLNITVASCSRDWRFERLVIMFRRFGDIVQSTKLYFEASGSLPQFVVGILFNNVANMPSQRCLTDRAQY